MNIRAVDCHMHFFGEAARYPFAPRRSYTVPPASSADYRKAIRGTDIARLVIVQPSLYGTDNSCTLDALDELGDMARGVAVIDPEATGDTELATMHERGVRGVRLNLHSVRTGAPPIETVLPAIDRLLAGSTWHIQIFCAPEMLAALSPLQDGLSRPIVLDHFGLVDPLRPELHIGDLGRLVDNGAWVKLSGSYRISTGPDGPGVVDLARQVHAMAPDRMVWASDWPHTPKHDGGLYSGTEPLPFQKIDTAGLYHAMERWFPDADTRRAILQDNPCRLYDWAD